MEMMGDILEEKEIVRMAMTEALELGRDRTSGFFNSNFFT
jgi:hypothetical protein